MCASVTLPTLMPRKPAVHAGLHASSGHDAAVQSPCAHLHLAVWCPYPPGSARTTAHLAVQRLRLVVLPADAVELGQVVAGGGHVGVVLAKALPRHLNRLFRSKDMCSGVLKSDESTKSTHSRQSPRAQSQPPATGLLVG